MRFPQKECQCGFESRLGYMKYTLTEPPKGYTWTLLEADGDPFASGVSGKTYEIKVYKDGSFQERRGVFVPENRASETQAFITAMEGSLRASL